MMLVYSLCILNVCLLWFADWRLLIGEVCFLVDRLGLLYSIKNLGRWSLLINWHESVD